MRLQTKPLQFRLKLGFRLTELTCPCVLCQAFLWKHVVSSSSGFHRNSDWQKKGNHRPGMRHKNLLSWDRQWLAER